MTENEIIDFIKSLSNKTKFTKLNENIEVVNFLSELFPDENLSILSKAYSLIHNKSAYCEVCNSILPDIRKYTCSHKCSSIRTKPSDHIRVQKQKETLLDKYGVTNIANIPGIQDKRIESMIEKYGDKISPLSRLKIIERTNNLNSKGRKTLLDNYYVSNPGQLPDHSKKMQRNIY